MNAAILAIHAERPADAAAIRALHRAAFGGTAEADLVGGLHDEDAVVLSLVAEEANRVIGHVLYSRLLVDTEAGQDRALALAPLAVDPTRQKRRIGSGLVGEAHRQLVASGETLIFVVGDPAYYSRFGFSAQAAQPFRTPYDGPYLMALALAAGAPVAGTVRYPAPFARLG